MPPHQRGLVEEIIGKTNYLSTKESLPNGPGFQGLNKDGPSLARSWHSD